MSPFIYFLLFLKASLFSTGGMGNLPSLHQDLLGLEWASEADFGKSIAIGQISPGPSGLWVISLGYLTFGLWGVILVFIAITLPPFLVLGLAAVYNKIEHRPSVRGLLRGVALAVVGLTGIVVWSLLTAPGVDWKGWLIALVSTLLALTQRVQVIIILLAAGVAGYLLYGL